MEQPIARIVQDFSNSALRMPVAWGQLVCGHSCEVKLRPTVYACGGCSVHSETARMCACGYKGGFRVLFIANAHNESDRITKVGDVVECAYCDTHAKNVAWLKTLKPGDIHHSRASRYGRNTIYVYRLDHTSPSNFFLAGACEDTPETAAILRALGAAALSPTECA